MKMILTTMEAFELNYKRGKTMFAQVVVCAPRSSPDLHSRLAALQLWPSMQQVFVKFSHNDGDWGCPITTVMPTMMMLKMMILKMMMLTTIMDTNGNSL